MEGRRVLVSTVERKFIKLNNGKQSVSISAADGGKKYEVQRYENTLTLKYLLSIVSFPILMIGH